MMLSITYGLVMLTIDDVKPFYNYWTFKPYVKIRVSVKTRVTGNSNSLFKMAESLLTLKDSFIFLIFLCVRIKINSRWQRFVA